DVTRSGVETCATRLDVGDGGASRPPIARDARQGSVTRRLLAVPRAQVAADVALPAGSIVHVLLRAAASATRRRGAAAGWSDANVCVPGRPSVQRVLPQGRHDVYELSRSALARLSR